MINLIMVEIIVGAIASIPIALITFIIGSTWPPKKPVSIYEVIETCLNGLVVILGIILLLSVLGMLGWLTLSILGK